MRKILFAFICVFIIFGCGGDEEKEKDIEYPFVGTWVVERIELPETEKPTNDELGDELVEVFEDLVKELAKGATYVFRKDGTFEIHLLGEKSGGTYTIKGNSYTMKTTYGSMLEGTTSIETGTWVRSGNVLKLTNSEGGKIILQLL